MQYTASLTDYTCDNHLLPDVSCWTRSGEKLLSTFGNERQRKPNTGRDPLLSGKNESSLNWELFKEGKILKGKKTPSACQGNKFTGITKGSRNNLSMVDIWHRCEWESLEAEGSLCVMWSELAIPKAVLNGQAHQRSWYWLIVFLYFLERKKHPKGSNTGAVCPN